MKNAGSTFQKSMDQVLSLHHNYCRSYIDDVPVFSETWSDHMQHLEGVFKTLRAVGFSDIKYSTWSLKMTHVLSLVRHARFPLPVKSFIGGVALELREREGKQKLQDERMKRGRTKNEARLKMAKEWMDNNYANLHKSNAN
ncbi:hypothetical protein TNCV_1632391 [Trichonephila clavipes]|nr:hypothetical protein TNCV_1632391 [Trichonephila clavipes]